MVDIFNLFVNVCGVLIGIVWTTDVAINNYSNQIRNFIPVAYLLGTFTITVVETIVVESIQRTLFTLLLTIADLVLVYVYSKKYWLKKEKIER
ncbi:MAG: hypothetical protein ACTSRU_07360 [Candidatus Hodarchaeales archaeon]